jgi:hypothetical protein
MMRFANGMLFGTIVGLGMNIITDEVFIGGENALAGMTLGGLIGAAGIFLPPSGWFLDTVAGVGGVITGVGLSDLIYAGFKPPVRVVFR